MTRATDLLLRAALLLAVLGSIGQLAIMILDVVLALGLRWYWGGAIAFFVAPVAFALTLRLLDARPVLGSPNA